MNLCSVQETSLFDSRVWTVFLDLLGGPYFVIRRHEQYGQKLGPISLPRTR